MTKMPDGRQLFLIEVESEDTSIADLAVGLSTGQILKPVLFAESKNELRNTTDSSALKKNSEIPLDIGNIRYFPWFFFIIGWFFVFVLKQRELFSFLLMEWFLSMPPPHLSQRPFQSSWRISKKSWKIGFWRIFFYLKTSWRITSGSKESLSPRKDFSVELRSRLLETEISISKTTPFTDFKDDLQFEIVLPLLSLRLHHSPWHWHSLRALFFSLVYQEHLRHLLKVLFPFYGTVK